MVNSETNARYLLLCLTIGTTSLELLNDRLAQGLRNPSFTHLVGSKR